MLDERDSPESSVPASFSVRTPGYQGTDPVSELVFIDQSVAGWQDLVVDLQRQQSGGRNLEVVLLDPARDGIFQMTQALSQHRGLQSVHVVSHASDGFVKLGGSFLSDDSLAVYAPQLGLWSNYLDDRADLLFYGCNLAATAEGRMLADSLNLLTGADVASSVDVTGSLASGGDWDLEYQTGVIDSQIAFSATLQSTWQYVLDVNINQAWLNAQGPGPYYLDQAGETYVLQTDVSTAGTAFAIIAQNVVFDLNGHTITYDNAAPISVVNHSFEAGNGAVASNWDFSNAPSASRFQGNWLQNQIYDGDYSLRFNQASSDQSVIASSTVTLNANTTYSLSGMFAFQGDNPGVESYVRITETSTSTVHETTWASTNYRGIQFRENVFTTGGSTETYRVEAGIRNTSASPTAVAYIDDIKIQSTRAYGVAAGTWNWAQGSYPGINRWGLGHGATVRNGSIVQGTGSGTKSHGIYGMDTLNATYSNLSITVHGASTANIKSSGGNGLTISGNQFFNNSQTIEVRDYFDGAAVLLSSGHVFNNTIEGGPQIGIISGNGPSNIHDNTIRLKSRYSNDFAIMMYGDQGGSVHNNTILNGSGDYSSRGIFVGGNSTNTRVYNNNINVQALPRNQEYGGAPLGGAYGIQLEDSVGVEIYGNTVNANAVEVEAYAFRVNGSDNAYVHDNVFNAFRLGAGVEAATLKFDVVLPGSSLRFENNLLETNYSWFGDGIRVQGISLIGNTLKASGDLTGFEALETMNYYLSDPYTLTVRDLRFQDTLFHDETARQLLNNAMVINHYTGDPDTYSSFIVSYTTTVRVHDAMGTAVGDASVTITDTDGNEVFSGTTDANGEVQMLLDEFRTEGSTKSAYGPYTVTVSSSGQQTELQFSADQAQTVAIELDINNPSSDDYLLTYDGSTLLVDATAGDNDFLWSAANPLQFTVDGFNFNVAAGTALIVFRGAGGNDTIALTGSAGNDELVLNNDRVNFTTTVMQVRTNSINDWDVDGGGGDDVSYLHGTAGDDEFELAAASANVTTDFWNYQSTGFNTVIAYDTPGTDTARFFDSPGDDQFNSYDGYSVMFSGDSYLRAEQFEITVARADLPGFDKARLFDTAGNDTLTANTEMARLVGGGQSREVWGFSRTFIESRDGGNDTANLVGGAGADTVVGDVGLMTFLGTGFLHQTTGFTSMYFDGGAGANALYLIDSAGDDFFELSDGHFYWDESARSISADGFVTQVITSANGGTDTIHFLDTAGDDSFTSFSDYATMYAGSSYLRAGDFETIKAFSTGGTDQATFIGAAVAETVNLYADVVQFTGDNGYHEANNFANTTTNLSSGGADTVNLYGTAGDDTLQGNLDWQMLYGAGYSNYVYGHSGALIDGGGGYDMFFLTDSAGHDHAELHSSYATLASALWTIEMVGFEGQYFTSTGGGNDSVAFYDSALDDYLYSVAEFTEMTNGLSAHRATGFTDIAAHAGTGGSDAVSIRGTSSPDDIFLSQNYGWYNGGGLTRYFEGFDTADVYLDTSQDQFDESDVWYEYTLIDKPG